MSSLPKKCVVDTNVPRTANRAIDPTNIPDELAGCLAPGYMPQGISR